MTPLTPIHTQDETIHSQEQISTEGEEQSASGSVCAERERGEEKGSKFLKLTSGVPVPNIKIHGDSIFVQREKNNRCMRA